MLCSRVEGEQYSDEATYHLKGDKFTSKSIFKNIGSPMQLHQSTLMSSILLVACKVQASFIYLFIFLKCIISLAFLLLV